MFFFFLRFIYFLVIVDLTARGLSLVAESGATLELWRGAFHCGGFSCCRERALGVQLYESWLPGPGAQAQNRVSVHRLSCATACGLLPDQGSNQCPRHCKADS